MVTNGLKWSQMVQNGENGENWLKWSKMVKFAKTGQNWQKNSQNGLKSFERVQNGLKWSLTV